MIYLCSNKSLSTNLINMKQFFTTVLGSFVGVWIALMLSTVFSVLMSFAMFAMLAKSSSFSKKSPVSDESILHLKLAGTFEERDSESDFYATLWNKEVKGSSLQTTLSAIKNAKYNNKVKGIYIECSGAQAGITTLTEIRKALKDFKASKKFIYAYGDQGILQGDYYVASVADSIFINPIGSVDIHGLVGTTMYYKKVLDKIGVQMQVFRVGAYKSYVEPYITDTMSKANREQLQHLMGSVWNCIADSMAVSRHITAEKINILADSILVMQPAEYLLKNKIVDATCYKTDFENKLRKLTNVDKGDDINFAEPEDLASEESGSGKKIAVVYAVGEIDGSSEDGINSDDLIEKINDLASDDDVAGMVLRVNSPGGSAFGSEQIWKALQDFKAKGKPLAVSMGDMAASGGYYISCGADRIFAEPVTITGSIGIFGMIPSFRNLVEQKIGISQYTVETNANSDFLRSVTTDISPVQGQALQNYVNRGYELFTSRCAAGRKINIDSIKAIAQGRVWDGLTAQKIGLVDQFGNLEDAVVWTAKKAKLSDYQVSYEENEKDDFAAYFSKLLTSYTDRALENQTGILYQYHDVIQRILKRDRIQCYMDPIIIK
jgi:protease-4